MVIRRRGALMIRIFLKTKTTDQKDRSANELEDFWCGAGEVEEAIKTKHNQRIHTFRMITDAHGRTMKSLEGESGPRDKRSLLSLLLPPFFCLSTPRVGWLVGPQCVCMCAGFVLSASPRFKRCFVESRD